MAVRQRRTAGVYREEIDVSEILVPTGISNGGIVVNSTKGPVNRPVLITNDKEYIDTFGEPYFVSGVAAGLGTSMNGFFPEYGYGSYAALQFLKESSVLYVVRNINSGDKYAGVEVKANQTVAVSALSGTSAIYVQTSGIAASTTTVSDRVDRIQNLDTFAEGLTNNLLIGALYPGQDGNNIAVNVEVFSMSADWVNSYDNYSSGTTTADHPIACKVFKLNVYEKDSSSNWTDFETLSGDTTNNRLRMSPIETFYGTLIPQLDGNNNQLFIENMVNGSSKYIYVKVKGGSSFTVPTTVYNNLPVRKDSNNIEFVDYLRLMQLGNGAVVAPTNAGLDATQVDSYALFEDRENSNIGILIAPTYNSVVKQEVARIAAKRADCIAVVQTGDPTDETVASMTDGTGNSEIYGYSNPSYLALYDGWSKDYDKYNDRFLYLPNAIYAAMIYARVDNIAYPWDAPAGINRGTIQVFDQRRIWTFDEIGQLYDKNINSVRFIPGTGFVMWGQKTAQLKKSALDRVNVRRNLLYIENNIENNLVQFVFENNTTRTRLRVFSLIDPFLSQVKAAGGLTDYKLVVDETNNTTDVIDANQMNVDVYVQPSRTAEFINLRTIITRTGVSFEEIRIA